MKWIGAPLELTETADPEVFAVSHDFGFQDRYGSEWIAPKGTLTDGASIPDCLWVISGAPLQGPYRDAAVIHDAYYQSHTRSRARVDYMFYEAMRFAGTPAWKAWMMWKAVELFGRTAWKRRGTR